MTTIQAAKKIISNRGRCLSILCRECPLSLCDIKEDSKEASPDAVSLAREYLKSIGEEENR